MPIDEISPARKSLSRCPSRHCPGFLSGIIPPSAGALSRPCVSQLSFTGYRLRISCSLIVAPTSSVPAFLRAKDHSSFAQFNVRQTNSRSSHVRCNGLRTKYYERAKGICSEGRGPKCRRMNKRAVILLSVIAELEF